MDVFRPGTPALESVLDGITTYSIHFWGARRDSIHFFSGATGFADEDWADLEDADPDRIYTFSAISQPLLERLQSLRPWSINLHQGLGGDSLGQVPTLAAIRIHCRRARNGVTSSTALRAVRYHLVRLWCFRHFGNWLIVPSSAFIIHPHSMYGRTEAKRSLVSLI